MLLHHPTPFFARVSIFRFFSAAAAAAAPSVNSGPVGGSKKTHSHSHQKEIPAVASSNSDASKRVILSARGVNKVLHGTRRKTPIFDDVNLGIFYGAKIGVLGVNGVGKSTLLRILAGKDNDFDGEVIRVKGITVGMLDQEPQLDENKTVSQVVAEGVQHKLDLLDKFDELMMKMGEENADFDKISEEQTKLEAEIERLKCWDVQREVAIAMKELRCPPPDAPINILSGGERRRTALARLLLSCPDVLFLDEPTNHLDAECVLWLEQYLKMYKGTVIAVTHDRYFLDNVANWILEVSRGKLFTFQGNYSSWLEMKAKRDVVDHQKEASLQKMFEKELAWVRMSPAARRSKSKARLANFAKLEEDCRQISGKSVGEGGSLVIPPGRKLGAEVMQVSNLGITVGNRVLFENLSFRLERGAILGIVGPNGVGKSTLLRILCGDEKECNGDVRLGETVQIGFVSQSRSELRDDQTVYEAISDGLDAITLHDGQTMSTRAYVAQFNFKGVDQEKKVISLSGGERNRVHLARLLKCGCNLLILDEPTNDLDVQTLRALEEAIPNFEGSAIIVSHDRWFLDRLCTHILAFDGEGHAIFYHGNFSDYERERQQQKSQKK